jgi:hypothetical protein
MHCISSFFANLSFRTGQFVYATPESSDKVLFLTILNGLVEAKVARPCVSVCG